MTFMRTHVRIASSIILLSGLSQADLTAWTIEVAAGSPATYTDTNLVVPSVVDIGVHLPTAGLTYEFVVNATNDGLSSTLMGARNTGVGTDSAFKFEQYADSAQYGLTESGVADHFMGLNHPGVDTHIAFVVDVSASLTLLYVNGLLAGSASHAPYLLNSVGIGQWYSPTSVVDVMTGTIYGVATYESMLSAGEVLSHADAFLNGSGPLGTNYCLSVPNSTANPALLTATGSLAVSDNLLHLEAAPVPDQVGIFYYGPAQTQQVYGNGFRCINSGGGIGLQRLPVMMASNNLLALDVDLLLPPTMAGLIQPGSTWCFQAFFSDPLGGGAGFNFSDAIELQFQ